MTSSSLQQSYDDGSISPNGHYALKITHRGDVSSGLTQGTIWLFRVDDIQSAIDNPAAPLVEPIPLVSMSAAANGYTLDFENRGNVILHPRWSQNAKSLFFLGRDGQENRRLYRIPLRGGMPVAMSPANKDVFAFAESAGRVAMLVGENVDASDLWDAAEVDAADIVVGTGVALNPLLFPNFREYVGTGSLSLEVWVFEKGEAKPVVASSRTSVLKISVRLSASDVSISPDGSHIVVSPLTDADRDDSSDDNRHKVINLATGAVNARGDAETDGEEWRSSWNDNARLKQRIALSVYESLNEPPVLVATDPDSGRSREIFDPNPQLSKLELLPVTRVEWQDKHGRTITGGLIKPADFKAGRKYPLVIQTHGFDSDRFYRVGHSDTASAGRAIASRGIVVLQVAEPSPWGSTPIDLQQAGLDVYLGAIDFLAAEGFVDPEKVGISGYSFTGLTVATSLVEAPERFAAAVIANADPLTMTGYFSYLDSPNEGLAEQLFTGAPPFAEGLDVWRKKSPGFSTEMIRAPVLVAATDPFHLLSIWDFYAALRYQRKSVELQYIRSGQHNLVKVEHRVAHQEMIVDWFDFWLNDNERIGNEKSKQFERWRELRSGLGSDSH
ncbi:MAG: prolyl oligopeptidase family serine peptidase [Pseudomonadota bacterium]